MLRTTWALAVATAAAGPAIGLPFAQPPSLSLKSTIGSPGSEVRIPVYLEPGDTKILSLTFRVSFRPEDLAFVRLELASRRLEPVAKTSRAAMVEGESNLLEISLSNDAEPLPTGPLGWLIFRLADTVPVKELAVGLSRLSARAASGEDLARVELNDAKILVITKEEAETVTACFFYMH
jgi:hypothetical protein